MKSGVKFEIRAAAMRASQITTGDSNELGFFSPNQARFRRTGMKRLLSL